MKTPLIGREKESKILRKALESSEAELVAVTGRRRVGKTFLIKQVLGENINFEFTGIPDTSRKLQLINFGREVARKYGDGRKPDAPKSWQYAFFQLMDYLDTVEQDEKLTVFLDEVPWLATRRSGFISFFSYFWNQWAVNKNILVVICGSAASWMVQKIVRDRGGLHGRITQRIRVEPFNLYETTQYLSYLGMQKNIQHCMQLYMALGGIPYYLKNVNPKESAVQNIERICFNPEGALHDEFDLLYAALFDNHEHHVDVIRALAAAHYGLTRNQLLKKVIAQNGGRFSKVLDELEVSGFITSFFSFNTKTNKRYRLTDEYSLFYLRFIEPNKGQGTGDWNKISTSQAYKTWTGFAFENVGLRHINQIKNAIGISGVFTRTSTYAHLAKDGYPGIQIDLVIERADRVIELCEFKFYDKLYVINSSEAEQLRIKRQAFEHYTKTKYMVRWTYITAYGINTKESYPVDNHFTMDALFEPNR